MIVWVISLGLKQVCLNKIKVTTKQCRNTIDPQRRQALCVGVAVTVGVAIALALYYSLAPGTH